MRTSLRPNAYVAITNYRPANLHLQSTADETLAEGSRPRSPAVADAER